jgi:hypothetical protein
MAKGSDKQKNWPDKLVKVSDTPIYCATNNPKNGFRPGKRVEIGKLIPIDHRTVASNEIVIDLDSRSFAQNAVYANKLKLYFEEKDIPHYMYWSGGKGIHTHIFLNINPKDPKGIDLLTKANNQGCNLYSEIRLKLASDFVTEAGIDPKLIGVGKVVDLQKLKWDDIGGRNTLIRAEGGCNKKVDKDGNVKQAFKTFLKEIPGKKPKENTYQDVEYPDKIVQFHVDEEYMFEIAQNYLDSIKGSPRIDTIEVNFEGKYLILPGVKTVFEGLKEGERSKGALILSMAARLDGLDRAQCEKILLDYVNNCSQVPTKFTVDEANQWRDWVYKQPTVYWTCAHLVQLGVHDDMECPICSERHKIALEVFDTTEPLKIIKDALDITIVGEVNAKIELFLHCMASKLNPRYLVLIEGDASSGKTHLMKKVSELFGHEGEGYFVFSRFTEASLNRLDQETVDAWEGKIVIIEEIQGSSKVTEQLRVMISEGKVNLMSPEEIKNPDGSKSIVTKQKEVRVNCMWSTCNAEDADEGDQLRSRAVIINCDTSQSQTTKIMDHYLDLSNGSKSHKIPNVEEIRRAIEALRIPDKVYIPFADKLKSWWPSNHVRGRRDIQKFITLIEASAMFHQQHRTWFKDKHGNRALVASWQDAWNIVTFCGESIGSSIQGMGARDIKHWVEVERLFKISKMTSFNIGDICRWLKCASGTARNLASKWAHNGLIDNTSGKGLPAEYVLSPITARQIELDRFEDQCEHEMKGEKDEIKRFVDIMGENNDRSL